MKVSRLVQVSTDVGSSWTPLDNGIWMSLLNDWQHCCYSRDHQGLLNRSVDAMLHGGEPFLSPAGYLYRRAAS